MLVGDACVMMEFHDPRIATWRWFRHGVLRSSSHRARRPRRAPGTLSNDLIFQTAAIKLFLPKAQRRRYADFSYQHHTITNGAVLYGGIESGWRDRRARHTLRAYAQKHVGAHRDRDPATGLRTNWTTPDLRVRSCHVQEHVDGPFRPTYYVAPPHDATQAHRQRPPNFIAPFCGPGRRTALE